MEEKVLKIRKYLYASSIAIMFFTMIAGLTQCESEEKKRENKKRIDIEKLTDKFH